MTNFSNPMAVRQSIRLHQAKRLLDDTQLPMTQVSRLSGYSSQRRFNAHMLASYGRSPYDWHALLAFLATRMIPGVEVIEAGEYRRSIHLDDGYSLLRVRQDAAQHCLVCSISPAPETALLSLTEKLRSMFDLYAYPMEISTMLGREPCFFQRRAAGHA
jgi:AraC family transcriptional regulator of adaptative response / DNA-3-methyladenine glycosylase II